MTQMYRDHASNKMCMPIFYISIPKQSNVDCIVQYKQQAEEGISQLGDIFRDMFGQCSEPLHNAASTLWLLEEIRQLMTDQNHARRMWQVNSTLHFKTQSNQLHKRVRAAINEFRNECWNNFIESLSTVDNKL